jgi:hypothetical protein
MADDGGKKLNEVNNDNKATCLSFLVDWMKAVTCLEGVHDKWWASDAASLSDKA